MNGTITIRSMLPKDSVVLAQITTSTIFLKVMPFLDHPKIVDFILIKREELGLSNNLISYDEYPVWFDQVTQSSTNQRKRHLVWEILQNDCEKILTETQRLDISSYGLFKAIVCGIVKDMDFPIAACMIIDPKRMEFINPRLAIVFNLEARIEDVEKAFKERKIIIEEFKSNHLYNRQPSNVSNNRNNIETEIMHRNWFWSYIPNKNGPQRIGQRYVTRTKNAIYYGIKSYAQHIDLSIISS